AAGSPAWEPQSSGVAEPPQQQALERATAPLGGERGPPPQLLPDAALEDLDEGARPPPDLRSGSPAVRAGAARHGPHAVSGPSDEFIGQACMPWPGAADGHQALVYAKAARTAAGYLAKRTLDAKWVASHVDLAYYCKVPLALLEVGMEAEAAQALDVALPLCRDGGQGSASELYSTLYPQWPWLCIGMAAVRLDRREVAQMCFDRLDAYVHPITGSGLVQEPLGSITSWEADVFSTALATKAALVRGQGQHAATSGDSLLRALEANRDNMKSRRFSLRWSWADGFNEDEHPLCCVTQDGKGQLYSMLGFPALVLLELSMGAAGSAISPQRAAAFREGASELLGFLKGCSGLVGSSTSHSTALAAAMACDHEAATKIGDAMLAMRTPSGIFSTQSDVDTVESFDQSADIVLMLSRMGKMMGGTTRL
ncbi:unnamed protein product, partial [Prorocentrum cordatum]